MRLLFALLFVVWTLIAVVEGYAKRYKIRNRYVEVKILHIGLGSNFWHWRDIAYVLFGWA